MTAVSLSMSHGKSISLGGTLFALHEQCKYFPFVSQYNEKHVQLASGQDDSCFGRTENEREKSDCVSRETSCYLRSSE